MIVDLEELRKALTAEPPTPPRQNTKTAKVRALAAEVQAALDRGVSMKRVAELFEVTPDVIRAEKKRGFTPVRSTKKRKAKP